MNCPDCGAFVSEEDVFCGECGRPLAGRPPPQKPLTPEEAKDLPTVGLERPVPRLPPPTALPAPAKKRSYFAPVLVFVILGLLLLCVLAGGLVFWVGSRESSTAGPTQGEPEVRVLLYEEGFDDPDSGWDVFDEDDTLADYVDGEYRIGVYEAEYMAWGSAEASPEFTDFQVEVDARQVEGPLDNNFGLLIRYQPDTDAFYWFQISGDGFYSFDLREAGEWTALAGWDASDAIQQGVGATNRLKVICQGDRFSLYVNDVFLVEVTDNGLSSGQVGLAAGAFDEPGVVVHFDGLRVSALQE